MIAYYFTENQVTVCMWVRSVYTWRTFPRIASIDHNAKLSCSRQVFLASGNTARLPWLPSGVSVLCHSAGRRPGLRAADLSGPSRLDRVWNCPTTGSQGMIWTFDTPHPCVCALLHHARLWNNCCSGVSSHYIIIVWIWSVVCTCIVRI